MLDLGSILKLQTPNYTTNLKMSFKVRMWYAGLKSQPLCFCTGNDDKTKVMRRSDMTQVKNLVHAREDIQRVA